MKQIIKTLNNVYLIFAVPTARFLVATILLLPSGSAYSANYYISKSTGTTNGAGTSWTTARNELNRVVWSTVGSVGTVYIAAGTYTTGFPTLSISNITVKRATVLDHGTDDGWNDSFDGQVTVDALSYFVNLSSTANYFTFDGGSHSPWKFRVVGTRTAGGMFQINSASNITVRNLELDGNSEGAGNSNEDGFRIGGSNNLIVEHCYIHDYRQLGTGHNDGVQMPSGNHCTWRYNIFANNGQLLFLGDPAWGNQWVNGITIEHNLFYCSSGIGGGCYQGINLKGTNQYATDTTKIENNTFALRSDESSRMVLYYSTTGSNNTANNYFRNNVIYNSTVGNVAQAPNHSYNNYYPSGALSETGVVTSDPLFVNYANNDFHLQSNSPCINAGTSLGWQYDFDGNAITDTPDMGCFEYVAGTDVQAPTVSINPVAFELSQNYPNPFNPTTSIKYQVPQSSFVKISVYNILGIEVRTLVNKEQSVGSYAVKFDANGLSSGVYFYKIQAGEFSLSKKMLLTK